MSLASRFCRPGADRRFCRAEHRHGIIHLCDPCLTWSQGGTPVAKPIPIPVRRKLLERTLAGDSTATLATTFNLSPRTVRHLRRRFRERGADAVRPDYRAPERLRQAFPAGVREA